VGDQKTFNETGMKKIIQGLLKGYSCKLDNYSSDRCSTGNVTITIYITDPIGKQLKLTGKYFFGHQGSKNELLLRFHRLLEANNRELVANDPQT
jgi:hypothetical protein